MLKYKISDVKIATDLTSYLIKHPKAKKEQCFNHLTGRYGIMDRADFNFIWKNRTKA